MQNLLSWILPSSAIEEEGNFKLRRIGFTDMKHAVQNNYLLLNTLPEGKQECLIKGTVLASEEEEVVNELLEHDEVDKIIVLYGAHSADDPVEKKAVELSMAGFRRVYVYSGGLFEWLLLQDVYGEAEFPTTSKMADLLTVQSMRKRF